MKTVLREPIYRKTIAKPSTGEDENTIDALSDVFTSQISHRIEDREYLDDSIPLENFAEKYSLYITGDKQKLQIKDIISRQKGILARSKNSMFQAFMIRFKILSRGLNREQEDERNLGSEQQQEREKEQQIYSAGEDLDAVVRAWLKKQDGAPPRAWKVLEAFSPQDSDVFQDIRSFKIDGATEGVSSLDVGECEIFLSAHHTDIHPEANTRLLNVELIAVNSETETAATITLREAETIRWAFINSASTEEYGTRAPSYQLFLLESDNVDILSPRRVSQSEMMLQIQFPLLRFFNAMNPLEREDCVAIRKVLCHMTPHNRLVFYSQIKKMRRRPDLNELPEDIVDIVFS